MKKVLLLLIGIVLFLPAPAHATVGVGVGTGRIVIDEPLQSGGVYTLPPIIVFNTGDEAAIYSMYLTLNEVQDEYKPNPAWFSFSPAEFTLEPKKSQQVIPTFHPPLVTEPGKYFGYLEARPSRTVKQGSATIGVAAATKLHFELKSSNIFVSLWYRLRDIYLGARPWSFIVTAAIILTLLYRFLRSRINIQVSVTPTKKRQKQTKTDDEDTTNQTE